MYLFRLIIFFRYIPKSRIARSYGSSIFCFLRNFVLFYTLAAPIYIPTNSVCVCMHVHLCPTLCDPLDCSLWGPSVHVIFQARILEWVAIPFSRGSSWPTDRTQVSCISCNGRWILYHSTMWEALHQWCVRVPSLLHPS